MDGNKEKIVFFINKKASDKRSVPLPPLIESLLDQHKYTCSFLYWENQAIEMILPVVKEADILVAYGGDGTVNFLGTLCLQFNKKLAVLPFGSGNGLARHMGIPLNLEKAMSLLNTGKTSPIDVVQVNDKFCFNIAGLGFDAHVAHRYAANKGSGFFSYLKEIVKGIVAFKPVEVDIVVNNKTLRGSYFMIGVANGSQWGYGYTIFPEAQLNDGEMELFIIERLKIGQLPALIYAFVTKRLSSNKKVWIYKIQSCRIKSKGVMIMHLDGEAVSFQDEVKILLLPNQLQVIS